MADDQGQGADLMAGLERIERFDRNADRLWVLLHDPLQVAEHLAEILRGAAV